MLEKRLLLTLTICTAVSLSISQTAHAQIDEFKLTASDGSEINWFGYSVSISGNYVIVGAERDDDNGEASGSAYIFKRSGSDWVQEAKLHSFDGNTGDFFGVSVSISGDYAIVGALGDDENGQASGAAYIFKRTGTNWVQEAKLLAPTADIDDLFGHAVSISGDYAIASTFLTDDNGENSGSAYVFKRAGTSWVQEAKLVASDGATNDYFGWSVSISGDYLVVGAVRDNDNGIDAGSAYVFKRSDTTWVEETKLLAADGAADDGFGVSISISGDYVIVGSVFDDDNGDNSGSAYIFRHSDSNWVQEAKLHSSDGDTADFFGVSVSISEKSVVVGAFLTDDKGDSSGSAYIFSREGSNWVEGAKLLAFDGSASDWFGWSVAIAGDYAVVGAYLDDDNGENSGSAYVYSGILVGIDDEKGELPTEFALSQNYPNPFNPNTVIKYTLPNRSEVKLIIYNLRGEEVALLFNGTMPAGNHRISWDASNFASGIYFYRLRAGDYVQTKKMVFLK